MFISKKFALMTFLSMFLGIVHPNTTQAHQRKLDLPHAIQHKDEVNKATALAATGFASLMFVPPSIIVPNDYNTSISPYNPDVISTSDNPPILAWGINTPLNYSQPIYLTFNVPQNFVSIPGESQVIIAFVAKGDLENATPRDVEITLSAGFTPAGQELVSPTELSDVVSVANSTNIYYYNLNFVLTQSINPGDLAQFTIARNGNADTWLGEIYITSIEFRYPTGVAS